MFLQQLRIVVSQSVYWWKYSGFRDEEESLAEEHFALQNNSNDWLKD